MRVLVVDDEQPALDELAYLLAADPRVAEVVTSSSATEALRILQETEVDAVFLDIQMPGLTGLELAQVLSRFRTPPPVVFVTAHEQHAVEAFELRAVDYVLKPVRAEPARRGGTPGRRRRRRRGRVRAGRRRRPDRRRARRGDPVRQPLRHHPRRGAGRLRPAAHRDRVPPGAQPADDARGGVGARRVRPDPPLAAGLARPRHRGADGRRPLHGRRRRRRRTARRRARREPPAHPRAARAAAGPRTVGP